MFCLNTVTKMVEKYIPSEFPNIFIFVYQKQLAERWDKIRWEMTWTYLNSTIQLMMFKGKVRGEMKGHYAVWEFEVKGPYGSRYLWRDYGVVTECCFE